MPDSLASQQHHTLPRWFLENFTDREGMLHLARKKPRTFFKSKPENAFRRRDYYAAKIVGLSVEDQTAKLDSTAARYVRNILRLMREGVDERNLVSRVRAIAGDVQACSLFLSHLAYRSPRWMGDDFYSGVDALWLEAEKTGKDMTAMIQEANMQLVQSGEFVLVFTEVNAPAFIVGDCGPFISRDMELGVENKQQKAEYPNWTPAEQRIWMALSQNVALGVAKREADAKLSIKVLSDTASNADWVDHFNEICARHSEMIAGASEEWVCEASRKAWPDG